RGESGPIGPERRAGDRPGTGPRVSGVAGPVAHVNEFGRLRGALEDLRAGDALAQDLTGRRRVAVAVDVPAPDVERRDRQPLGDPVEVCLGGELGLWRTEAAERSVGWGVRPRRLGPDAHVRAAVRAAGVDRATREDDRGERAIRAAVNHDLDVLRDQDAIARHAGPMADDRRVALGRGRDVLVPVIDHPDGLLGLARQQSGMERDDRWELLLPTEPTTGLRLHHASGVVLEAESLL